jgi:glutamyl-tRNA synthetase
MEELISQFSMDRVHKGGAKFDYEKAKWFNHEWIKLSSAERLLPDVKAIYNKKGIAAADDRYILSVINMVKERCTLLTDFYEQSKFFYQTPVTLDTESIKPKWNADKRQFFADLLPQLDQITDWSPQSLEVTFKELAAARGIKVGELQLPFRIMLVGGKYGPAVFDIAVAIGKTETKLRIKNALEQL